MVRPRDRKKLGLKVKRYSINQALKECSGLEKVMCQKLEDMTESNVNRQNSSKVKM